MFKNLHLPIPFLLLRPSRPYATPPTPPWHIAERRDMREPDQTSGLASSAPSASLRRATSRSVGGSVEGKVGHVRKYPGAPHLLISRHVRHVPTSKTTPGQTGRSLFDIAKLKQAHILKLGYELQVPPVLSHSASSSPSLTRKKKRKRGPEPGLALAPLAHRYTAMDMPRAPSTPPEKPALRSPDHRQHNSLSRLWTGHYPRCARSTSARTREMCCSSWTASMTRCLRR
ncbi:hypothetical protein BC826DRAFT_143420 [Russula brevipes]|nr:hypothetical protein BC826DRAFT_143420 [Russula brevipes]